MKARLGQGLAHTTAKRHQAFAPSKPLGGLVTLFLKLFVFLKWPLRREQATTEGRRSQGLSPAWDSPIRLQGAFFPLASPVFPPAQSIYLSLHSTGQMRKLRPWVAVKSLLLQGSLPESRLRIGTHQTADWESQWGGNGGGGESICSLPWGTL